MLASLGRSRRCGLAACAVALGAGLGAAPLAAHPAASEQVAALDSQLAERAADATLWLARAFVWRDLGHRTEALADLERAERLGAALAEVELARGLVELAAGDATAAAHALDRSLASRPGNVPALVGRARARRLLGRFDEAAADFAAVRRASPRPDPGWVNEEVETLLAAGRGETALDALTAAAEQLGPLPSLVAAAVDIELAAGRPEAAIAWLDRGLALGDRASGLARRGELELTLGRDAAAAADFEAAWIALAARPPHRRATRAFTELETRLRAALVALGRPDPRSTLCLPAVPAARSLR